MRFKNRYGLLYRRLHHPYTPKTANLLKARKIWVVPWGGNKRMREQGPIRPTLSLEPKRLLERQSLESASG